MGIETEKLSAKAQLIRESLTRSQMLTNTMVGILGTFDTRLSSLETAMRPTQVRTHAFRKAFENIQHTLASADSILTKFDVSRQVEVTIVAGPRGDYDGYFQAIDQLQEVVEFFNQKRSFKSSEAALHHAKGLLNKAMTKLEEEFHSMLVAHSKSIEPNKLLEALPDPQPSTGRLGDGSSAEAQDSGDHSATDKRSSKGSDMPIAPAVLIPPVVIPELHGMALRMLMASYAGSCTKVYREVRSQVLEQTLRRLGAEKLSKEDVHRLQWEDLETKIASWTQYMKIAVKMLFSAERTLCDQVFFKLNPYREQVFAEVTESSMTMLLHFGEAIGRSKKAPEKLFLLLDMYETLRDLMPEILVIFRGAPSTTMCDMAHGLMKRLAQVARETFAEFEAVVERDNKPHNQLNGNVHQFTVWVMNYVTFLFKYQDTLKELFGEGSGKPSSYLADATKNVMKMLQENLEAKAKQFNNPALNHLFLMNNVHYIVRSVRKSEARDLLGDDWVQRHRRIVQQHASLYQRTAWGKIVTDYLSGRGLGADSQDSGVARSSLKDRRQSKSYRMSLRGDLGVQRHLLKERFKHFNTTFENLHMTQSQWIIPDAELRDAVRLSVAEVLLPAYRSFLQRYSGLLDKGKNQPNSKYIKYTPETLERRLGEFFEGKVMDSPPPTTKR